MITWFCPPPSLIVDIEALGDALVRRGMRCATAESCTGGLVGASITSVPGASLWFAGGIIAYANEVKMISLGVDPCTLEAHGAVSEDVVRQMAMGVCRALGVVAALSLSGVAGPSGGTTHKPVGLVCVGYAVVGHVDSETLYLDGSREGIRTAAVAHAVRGLLRRVEGSCVATFDRQQDSL